MQIAAPAKVNLFLEVLGRRPDGYHDLETLMVCVSLFDTIELTRCDRSTIELNCQVVGGRLRETQTAAAGERKGEFLGLEEIPRGEGNLVWQVVDAFRRRAGVACGAEITLTKRIPSRAGLGGGSSDAAAALWAANKAWNVNWPANQLAQMAAEFGSDIPFFLSSGAAICRGRGERVEPVESPGGIWLVLVRPPEGLSTATVFGHCHPASEPADVQPLVRALRTGSPRDIGKRLTNRLEPAARELCSWVGRLEGVFRQLDCLGHQMSGSGTSYFGICCHARHARRVAARLRNQRLGFVTSAEILAAVPRQADPASESKGEPNGDYRGWRQIDGEVG